MGHDAEKREIERHTYGAQQQRRRGVDAGRRDQRDRERLNEVAGRVGGCQRQQARVGPERPERRPQAGDVAEPVARRPPEQWPRRAVAEPPPNPCRRADARCERRRITPGRGRPTARPGWGR